MLRSRQFTVVVIPDAHAPVRRFHVRGRRLVVACAALAVVTLLALAMPVLLVKGVFQGRALDRALAENGELVARAASIEVAHEQLRREMQEFERRTEKLATMAGLDLPPMSSEGEGFGGRVESRDAVGARVERLLGESDELSSRGELVARRIETVEGALDAQSDRLSRMPSILPVRGLIGAGFAWRRDPFTGRRQFHRGLDISAPQGTSVIAPADGIVVKSEKHQGYGNVLYLSHGDGVITRYGHLDKFKVRAGDRVSRGDLIALVGSTGRSTAPHLHYEVLLRGKQVDPMDYILDDGLFY